jgi:hypothetical protein
VFTTLAVVFSGYVSTAWAWTTYFSGQAQPETIYTTPGFNNRHENSMDTGVYEVPVEVQCFNTSYNVVCDATGVMLIDVIHYGYYMAVCDIPAQVAAISHCKWN